MTASAPIRGPDERLLGVLAGRLNLEQMNAIISRRNGLDQTEDAYLVEHLELVREPAALRHRPGHTERGVHTEAIQRCLQRESGEIEQLDYRNTPVISVYRWMPDRELCLVVEMDQAEAFAPTNAFGRTILLIGFLTLLAAAGLAYWLAQTISQPVRQLLRRFEKIVQGNLEYPIRVNSVDELGALGAAFNRMAAAIAEKEAQLRNWAALNCEQHIED